jgi:MerR family transcriptional regulator, light-induced transcriptional regulator
VTDAAPDLVPDRVPLWTIADVERQTGLGKDTLRVWERRYGFPTPQRDAQGQRVYTQAEVHRLQHMAQLLRAGHRPGRVVGLSDAEMQALLAPGAPVAQNTSPAEADAGTPLPAPAAGAHAVLIEAALAALTQHDGLALRRQLQQALARLGLAEFVIAFMAPLTARVGQAWLNGTLRVAEEHLYTEMAHGVLRQALLSLPEPDLQTAPRVLLTTLPGEPHGLGLLMAEAMCTLDGAMCVNLGVQTPVDDIVAAARWHASDVVGLSATGCLPTRWLRQGLEQLRERLPAGTALWLGGSPSAASVRGLHGVARFDDLRAIGPALWARQAARGAAPP